MLEVSKNVCMNISDRNSDRNFDRNPDRNSDRNSDWNSARNSDQNFRSPQLPEFVLEKLAIIVHFIIPGIGRNRRHWNNSTSF